jgi:hypothetical protein
MAILLSAARPPRGAATGSNTALNARLLEGEAHPEAFGAQLPAGVGDCEKMIGAIEVVHGLRENRFPREARRVARSALAGVAMRNREPRIIELPKFHDSRGSLSSVEAGGRIPFEIRRVFYIYEIPAGATRAGHAQRTCEQLIVAVSGAFDVISDDGATRSHRRLDSADCGFYVPPLTWLELENFTPGAVCLVLASEPYSEGSYIRAYDQFKVAAAA